MLTDVWHMASSLGKSFPRATSSASRSLTTPPVFLCGRQQCLSNPCEAMRRSCSHCLASKRPCSAHAWLAVIVGQRKWVQECLIDRDMGMAHQSRHAPTDPFTLAMVGQDRLHVGI